MKRLLIGLLLALVTVQVQATPQVSNLTIEGRVLRKSTSEALSGVLVLLTASGDVQASGTSPNAATLATQLQILRMSSSSGRGIDESLRNVLKAAGSSASSALFAFTDNGGRFSFKDLSPGSYNIRVAREGFFGPKRNGTHEPSDLKAVELQASSPPVWVEVGLAQGAVIQGRVRNTRAPAARTAITAYRMVYVYGKEKWKPELTVNPNTLGEFRLQWLPPGEWYIGAKPPNQPDTFFRDVADASLATKIVAREGETTNIEINLPSVAANLAPRVSGSAVNPYGPQNSVGAVDYSVSTFLVVPRNPSVADEPYQRFSNTLPSGGLMGGRRMSGEFEIGPVAPGSYDLIAYYVEPSTRRILIGKAPFQVISSDVRGISAPIQAGVTLSGEIRVNGVGAELINPVTLSPVLESLGAVPTAFATESNPIVVDASGRFLVYNVPQERYRLLVGQLPSTAYVADIRQGNQSVFDEGFELAGAASEILVMIQKQGQTVSGMVRFSDGIPAEGATVVLVPPEAKRRSSMHYRVMDTDANGAFSMQDVPPGEYTVFAWENILPTAWMNPKVLEKYEKRGRSISLTPGITLDLQLPLIPDAN